MAKKYDLKLKGYVGGWDFDTDYVDYVLDKAGDKEVSVLIDSLGGSVATALSVSTAFANHGNVQVFYRGMNASAATIASMGAKHVAIEASAMYLVHKCSFPIFEWAALNADQLRDKANEYMKAANDAEKIDLTIATLYAGRCKKSVAELLDLMKEEKWLTAQEALDWGFVDEVVDSTEDVHLTQSVATAMAAAGIPIPENMSVEADGFIAQLERMFAKWFGKKKEEAIAAVATAEPPVNSNNKQTESLMKKPFVLVAAILAAISAEVEADAEGKYTLDEKQMGAIEDALKAAQDKEAALNGQIADLQAKLDAVTAEKEALLASPANGGEHVVEDPDKAPTDTVKSPYEALAKTLAEAKQMMGK